MKKTSPLNDNDLTSLNKEQIKDLDIDELTDLFMEKINDQNLMLIEGLEFLMEEDFKQFEQNLNNVIQTTPELQIKKTFESKIWKKRSAFTKADRLTIFSRINEIKNKGEHMANKLLLYRTILPDEKFKLRIMGILKSLKMISNGLTDAVKSIGPDLREAHDMCERVKEERRKMRDEEWAILKRLYNYSMDYISRTFIYLKEMIEDIMMMADYIKNFAEYIQFLATKYLIFE